MEPQKKRLKLQKARCVVFSDEKLQRKQEAGKNKNTTKTEERANQAFQKFLRQCGESNVDYWFYEEPELDNYLSKFYFGARKDADSDFETDSEDPERQELMYSANTMRSFRYALSRILQSKGHEYDIMHKNSLSFKKSQQAFLDSQKELKALGKAQIKSAPEITEEGKHCFLHSLHLKTPIVHNFCDAKIKNCRSFQPKLMMA